MLSHFFVNATVASDSTKRTVPLEAKRSWKSRQSRLGICSIKLDHISAHLNWGFGLHGRPCVLKILFPHYPYSKRFVETTLGSWVVLLTSYQTLNQFFKGQWCLFSLNCAFAYELGCNITLGIRFNFLCWAYLSSNIGNSCFFFFPSLLQFSFSPESSPPFVLPTALV